MGGHLANLGTKWPTVFGHRQQLRESSDIDGILLEKQLSTKVITDLQRQIRKSLRRKFFKRSKADKVKHLQVPG